MLEVISHLTDFTRTSVDSTTYDVTMKTDERVRLCVVPPYVPEELVLATPIGSGSYVGCVGVTFETGEDVLPCFCEELAREARVVPSQWGRFPEGSSAGL